MRLVTRPLLLGMLSVSFVTLAIPIQSWSQG